MATAIEDIASPGPVAGTSYILYCRHSAAMHHATVLNLPVSVEPDLMVKAPVPFEATEQADK